MKKLILGVCFGVALACAPELHGGKGERCDELSACEEGFECYRGFCVADESTSEPAPIVGESDAGFGQRSAQASDAGGASARPARTDASTSATQEEGSASSNSDDVDPPASKPASPPAPTPPATGGEPGGRTASPDAGQAAPPPEQKPSPAPSQPPAATPPALDAGVRVDAAVSVSPDAALPLPLLPKNCTVQDCCDEALRSQGAADDDRGKGGKKCGCADLALVPALLGALTCTAGGVVWGLL